MNLVKHAIHITCLLFLAPLVLSGSGLFDAAAASSLRVMTYNIRFGFHAGYDLNKIADVVKNGDVIPDVICLQEADINSSRSSNINQTEALANILSDNNDHYDFRVIPFHFNSSGNPVVGNGLLSKWPIIKTNSFQYSDTSRLIRSAVVADISNPNNGDVLRVVCTHLGGGHLAIANDVRIAHLMELEEKLVALEIAGGPEHTILAGDFNHNLARASYTYSLNNWRDVQTEVVPLEPPVEGYTIGYYLDGVRTAVSYNKGNGIGAIGAPLLHVEYVSNGESDSIDVRVSANNDDAEEQISGANKGKVSTSSSDLELSTDANGPTNQLIGMRFINVGIPIGATITDAWIQFQVDEVGDNSQKNLSIWAQAADNPGGFSTAKFDLSSRTRTANFAAWNSIAPWNNEGDAGSDQRSSDLTTIIQEVVDRPGWQSGQAIVTLISDGGGDKRDFIYLNKSAGWQIDQTVIINDVQAADGMPFGTAASDHRPVYADVTLFDANSVPGSIEVRVSAGNDDAEENLATGDVNRGSSDLELSMEGTKNQLIGMRFTGVAVPAGATITNAWVQFQVDELHSGATDLTIRAQATGNPSGFSATNGNLSTRQRTVNSVDWLNVAPWNTPNAAGSDQRTPDLTTVIQEVINNNGWQSGQPIVVLIDGSGRRTAVSYNKGNDIGPAGAPLLHIDYLTNGQPPPPPGESITVEVRVSANNDDAEESLSNNGSMYLGSSDLELIADGTTIQQVGMRFTGVAIPAGATVTNAWMQFQADETNSGVAELTIRAQAADDPGIFTSTPYNISSRNRTGASVPWTVEPWTVQDVATSKQRTPDLKTVIQEVVARGGWQSGQAIVMLIDGSGERTAESHNGNSAAAPLLHIEYETN